MPTIYIGGMGTAVKMRAVVFVPTNFIGSIGTMVKMTPPLLLIALPAGARACRLVTLLSILQKGIVNTQPPATIACGQATTSRTRKVVAQLLYR